MTEIISGIYQLKVPIPNNPLGNTNSYLLKDKDGYFIIDPGMNQDESFNALEKELAGIGVDFKQITRILATHSHGDHYGLAGRVKKLSNATIIVHEIAKDHMLRMAKHRRGGEELENWLAINGVPKSDPAEMQRQRHGPQGEGHQKDGTQNRQAPPNFPEPTPPDALLHGGETINVGDFALEVIFTPGHDPGHICLYETNNRILFSGDHILPVITPSVGLQTDSALSPLGDFIRSLNSVRDLDVSMVLPAHEQTFTDLRGRVDQILAHHTHRDAEIVAAMNGEARTAYEISQEITWMPSLGGKKFEELAHWDKRMAVMETLAHLKVMKDSGKVGTISKESVIYYQGNGHNN